MADRVFTRNLGGAAVELLPNLPMVYGDNIRVSNVYFQRGILSRFIYFKKNGVTHENTVAEAMRRARNRWVVNASALCHAGLGKAVLSTWNTRVNCKPVLVKVTPSSFACDVKRICPFCYTRICTHEYNHLCGILFDKGSDVCNWHITAQTKRNMVVVSSLNTLESKVRDIIADLMTRRDKPENRRKLDKMAGWARSQRAWVEVTKDGKFEFMLETTLIGVTKNEMVPATVFMTKESQSLTREEKAEKKKKGGLIVYSRLWTDPAMTRAKFLAFMIQSLKYKTELLKHNINVSMALQRPMLDLRMQQFYRGGVLSSYGKSGRDAEECEESEGCEEPIAQPVESSEHE